jgi:uncharacterized repeat protein (TIGR03803 family)
MSRIVTSSRGGMRSRRRGAPRLRRQPSRAAASAAAAVLALPLLVAGAARAQEFSVLHAFSGGDGSSPSGALVQGPDGNFYGTTQLGGESGQGTVFGMDAAGNIVMQHELGGAEGADPFAPLFLGADGQLYGTTALGGPGGLDGKGTIFSFSLDGAYRPLHFFSVADGARPQTGLTQGSDGWFYGATSSGGAWGKGAVFAISPQGEYRLLHQFSGSDGDMPLGELVEGGDGWLYGTTTSGGSQNGGAVYRVSSAGDFALLHGFGYDPPMGNAPRGALVLGADGALYGTTEFGGEYDYGTIFRLTRDGVFTSLRSLCLREGTNPLAGLVLGNDGRLYGTTSAGGPHGGGTIFAAASTGNLSVLHAFTGGEGGGWPVSALMQARDGRLYGTTPLGGVGSAGTVFRLALPGPATATGSIPSRTHDSVLEEVRLRLPSSASALTLTIRVRRTPWLGLAKFQPVVSQGFEENCHITSRTIVCKFTLDPGTELPAGDYSFDVLLLPAGLPHAAFHDTFSLQYTSGGLSYAQTGRFLTGN